MVNASLIWDKKSILNDLKKYKTYSEYRKSKSYRIAVKNNMLTEISKHFKIKPHKQHNYWSYNRCKEEALKYDKKSDLSKNSPSAYSSIRLHGWLDELCSHMIKLRKSNGYWTYDKCQEETLKYNNLKDFMNDSCGCYYKCYKNNWLEELCTHMNYKKRKSPNFNWTKEECKEEALKYNNRYDYCRYTGSYKIALKNKWLNDICSHMIIKK